MEVPISQSSFELWVDLIVSEVVPEVIWHEMVDFSEDDVIDTLHELDVPVSFLLFPIVTHVEVGPFSKSLAEGNVLLEVGIVVVI